MEQFLHGISSVTIIFLLTAVGYFCGRKKWMGQETKAFISRLLLSLAVPFMCIYSLYTNLTVELLQKSGLMLAVTLLCSCISFLLSALAGRALKLPRNRQGVFVMMSSLSNCLFIGLAMCTELFGEVAKPYVMVYYCVNTSLTQTVGMALIRWSGDQEGKLSLKSFGKLLKMPTIWAIVIGFSLVLLEVKLPSLAVSFMKYMNNIVTPLALLLTGYIISEIGLKKLRLDLPIGVMLLFRFVLAPACCFGLCGLFDITGLARSVYVVEAAMPVVTQTVVASAEYHADEQFAAQGAAISTLASFLVIPLLMLLL